MRIQSAVTLALFTALLRALPIEARAQDLTFGPPKVQVGVFSSRLDGSVGGASASIDPDGNQSQLAGRLYVAACAMGAMGLTSRVPDLAIAVWEIQGQVLSSDDQHATARLSWQRLRVGGQPVNEAPTVTEVTLAPGQPATLESFTTTEAGTCPANVITLKAQYEPSPILPTGGRAGGGRGGGGAGRGVGSAGVTGTGRTTGGGAAGISAGGAGGAVGSAIVGSAGPSGFVLRALQRVELWLVHSAPGRADEVSSTSTTASMMVSDFAFAPVAIQTERGLITVRVTGTVEVGYDVAGKPALVFGARRRVSFVPAARQPRDGDSSIESGGVANTVVAVPGPSEVLSFEMPPLQGAGLPSVLDGFAIRVRLATPAANTGR